MIQEQRDNRKVTTDYTTIEEHPKTHRLVIGISLTDAEVMFLGLKRGKLNKKEIQGIWIH